MTISIIKSLLYLLASSFSVQSVIKVEENTIKILFVEDEPDLNVLINLSLEYTDGIEAEVVPSAEEALNYLKENKVHAIVSDHYLPGMLGIDLLVYVKNNFPDI